MISRELGEMCPIHGPGHMGQPCPEKTLDVVANPVEEFGDIDTLFQMENLSEHLEAVRAQMEKIREFIEVYERVREAHKTDSDMDQYVDETAEKLDDAFRHFSLNGKEFDIRTLCSDRVVGYDVNVDYYNKIVLAINDYIDMYMIGKNERFLETL